jgi:hypothetical protein
MNLYLIFRSRLTSIHWVESYVLENYRPEEREKRRREKWADESFKPSRRPLQDG